MSNIRLVTPVGRLSFAKIYKAEPNMAGTANVFSLKLLFPKSMNMDWIKNAWEKAAMEEFGTTSPNGLRPLFSAGNPFDDKGAIMDGDWKYNSMSEDKKDTYESYRDHWVMGFTAEESQPPTIVDENKVEILDQSLLQSGDYARVVMEVSAYTSKKFRSPNISIRFNVIQKDRAGERFSGGMSKDTAMDMLGDAPDAGKADDLY